ncbi:MAG: PilZ domain-containing protein [Desulfocapsa sp.]|jgi:hypothetical protein|uniref:PilZ domain-containing protein n=1 Tax=Desulfotalea psychrophila TaxID=84980 RepID=A0ABS3AUL6_9BACT|nr:PilZ domain-containing protein [Desulfocapsa sp.]MBN4045851.1 PilZ domain-containing protein [bacterium AH-315-P11]MBN4048835.1 PilZ domain-containing protein [bacterium AH-315-N22]MBN4068795.1 PilZ domain-containing protein [Desulfotalea psychrophila]
MAHKRIHVRVPLAGEVLLSTGQGKRIKTPVINISQGGVGIASPSTTLEQTEYQVEITTEDGEHIQFTATLVYRGEHTSGFKTSDIDKKNLQIIAELVAEFQSTEEFIKQVDNLDLFPQKFIDEDGREVSVTFEMKQPDE